MWHLVVEWLKCQSSQKIFLGKLIFRIMCMSQLWLNGWIDIPRKKYFLAKLIFRIICVSQLWLTWLNSQFSRNTWFSKICMSWTVVELVDSQNLDSRKLHFSKCVCCKSCWNGWLATLYYLFSREVLSLTYMWHLVVEWLNCQSSQK